MVGRSRVYEAEFNEGYGNSLVDSLDQCSVAIAHDLCGVGTVLQEELREWGLSTVECACKRRLVVWAGAQIAVCAIFEEDCSSIEEGSLCCGQKWRIVVGVLEVGLRTEE